MSAHDGALYAVVLQGVETVLLSVNAGTGEERWRVPFSSPVLIGPAAGPAAVVAVGDDDVAAGFDPRTGRLLWTHALVSPPCGSPLVLEDRVILWEGGRSEVLGGRHYGFTVLDLATGTYLGSLEAVGSSAFPGDCGSAPDGRLLMTTGLVAQIIRVATP
jgi:outer membrane protein assembly factor BamB